MHHSHGVRPGQQPSFENLSDRERTAVADGVRGGSNRRDMLRWLGGLGIGVAAGETILASAASAVADSPRIGGVFRVALHSTSGAETLDPAKQTLSTDYSRGRVFYNALTRIGSSGEAGPELAETFEPSADGREWIFRLRKGVEFHDGKSLTVQDVVYSLARHKDPATASVVKVLLDPVLSVTADGPSVVRVKLDAPNADLPLILGTTPFVIVKDGTTDFSRGVGTGPYRLDQAFVPGSRTVGKRSANYFWTGRPYFDEVHIFGIQDRVARANALFSGDVDAVSYLNPSTIDQMAGRPDLKVMNTKTSTFSQILMMMDRTPTDNLDFRLAVKYLLDRERFLKTVLRGYGQLGNDHVVPPNHPLYNKNLPQRAIDFDKAEYHLRQAGMKGARVELPVSDAAPGTIEMGQILQQSAARAGLTIDIKREPADGYWTNVWMKKPFVGSRWMARPTIDSMLSIGWLSNARWNDSGLKDPEFDRMVVAARGELDQVKRKQAYDDIQKYLYDRGGNAIFAFLDFIDGLSSKVKGIEPNPISELGGYYFADTGWFDT